MATIKPNGRTAPALTERQKSALRVGYDQAMDGWNDASQRNTDAAFSWQRGEIDGMTRAAAALGFDIYADFLERHAGQGAGEE